MYFHLILPEILRRYFVEMPYSYKEMLFITTVTVIYLTNIVILHCICTITLILASPVHKEYPVRTIPPRLISLIGHISCNFLT